MAYTSGTATDCRDFTDKVITWLTTSGTWTLALQQDTTDNNGADCNGSWGADRQEYILTSSGISGNENIIVGIREWEADGAIAYGWDLNAYHTEPSYFGEGLSARSWNTYNTTYNRWENLPMLQLSDGTIEYWIYSNAQRFVVVAKTSSLYHACYLGFGDRLAAPSEYPYPYYIAGSYYGNTDYTTGGYGPVRPQRQTSGAGYNSFFICKPDNTWERSYQSSQYVVLPSPGVLPTQNRYTWNRTASTTMGSYDNCYWRYDTTASGNRVLSPCYVLDDNASYMELDSIYAMFYTSLSSEDTYTDASSNTYRIFQQGSDINHYNFMAIKEE